jgi:hypothetical protein
MLFWQCRPLQWAHNVAGGVSFGSSEAVFLVALWFDVAAPPQRAKLKGPAATDHAQAGIIQQGSWQLTFST